ncbi:MAG: bifunctional [glutamate--ammonia ligase]-adenylyl-L-tyrosine phosphorylase/[glutamate--ammonia-ligase] adenylyltransferase [Magnetococcales bacterium]|nr:bifunctional [glutamate--ammonia ligase]-adenylyl-L-tyrosine phosphorylase/[glutamate--ammonia-ligase] adenylyltransferase [Magnetococcales bacterium]MBF0155927.1 bifunctional [glutamate--ammonia ligase]-adenylyl-L-tyrosine phosphorylase/[glutamate--ammonia-ligase] adenylyltransferase [Magnetococcales bacterium]
MGEGEDEGEAVPWDETTRQLLTLVPEVEAAILAEARLTADPGAVSGNVSRWATDFARDRPDVLPLLATALADPVWRRRLVRVAGNSPFLSHVMLRWPEFFADCHLSGQGPEAPTRRPRASELPAREVATRELIEALPRASTWEEAATLLRRHKHRQFLMLGFLDLADELELSEVTEWLSDIAEGCLEAALRWTQGELGKRHGKPRLTESTDHETARFVVLGMGKLGARELNFSSDIDLIFLCEDDQGETNGPRPIANKSYFARLSQELSRLIGERTADGRVFRVDLRLRPEGESGALCLSSRAAETYYESWGWTWERAAMIKARPVAGDLSLGEAFLTNLFPFVYRRYLDFAALDGIRRMKEKIDLKMGNAEDYTRNIKLGYGGIREIEFIVQSQQLIHGGKKPALQVRRTLDALQQMHLLGLISGESAAFLTEAYIFLRRVEHRLQIVREEQTHSLPTEPEGLAQLARRLGLADAATFSRRLKQVTDGVFAIYNGLFFEAGRQQTAPPDPTIAALFSLEMTTDRFHEAVTAAGFTHPEAAMGLIALLRHGPRGSALTESMQEWLTRLGPSLLAAIREAPDQDLALQHTERFLLRLGHRVHYLAMLVEKPKLMTLLVRLFGSSRLLSRYFNDHPELLDRFVTPGFLDHFRSRGEMGRELAREMAEADDLEARFRIIREFKNSEVLRLGVRDLSGLAELSEVMAGLSGVADVVLIETLEGARRELVGRHGSPVWCDATGEKRPVPFAIVAMGKLGGGELNYASDLDLIFIHGNEGDGGSTDGDRPLDNSLFFTRLGQKIITNLTTLTQHGKLYELDMRLRPSGNSGPLVTSLAAFLKYQHEEAWTWEHQALTRARIVVAEEALARTLTEELQAVIRKPREIGRLRREVDEMRERMFADKKPPPGVIDIKQSRGGIVDIEFITQYLILAHADRHPQLMRRNVTNALLTAGDLGLLDRKVAATLLEAYGFLRLLENRLRLLHDRSENRLPQDAAGIRRLQRLMPETMVEIPVGPALEEHMNRVLPIYRAIFEVPSP